MGRHGFDGPVAAIAALAVALLWAASPSPALAANPHPRIATPPLHIKRNATPSYSDGYQPLQIWHAYQLDQLACMQDSAHPCGTGQTIGIVDAYDDPTVEADLQTFDTQFGLPSCTIANGCLLKATPQGTPQVDDGWAREISLDVQWAHAIAPGARILVVESVDKLSDNLLGAVDYAVSQGASVISMSWGSPEASDESLDDHHFNVNGVSFVAASGDKGSGTQYPAASPYVISVGGTSLSLDSAGERTAPETAWSGSGGGASLYETLPNYQVNFGIAATTRAMPDVAYVGDPSTGVAVYDSTPVNGVSGWYEMGGTSAGTPQWAALLADANSLRATPLSTTNVSLYQAATGGNYATDYHDIVSGSNGTCGATCTAGPGFDMVTGLGSPNTTGLLPFLAPGAALIPTPTPTPTPTATPTPTPTATPTPTPTPIPTPTPTPTPTATPTPTPTPTPLATPTPSPSVIPSPSSTPSPSAPAPRSNGTYTFDAYGGIYPVAGTPAFYSGVLWPGWKIAQSAAIFADGSGGYVLDGYGGLHPFGRAPSASGAAYFPGFAIARDVALLPSATPSNPAGYTLEGYGGLHPFGGAPAARGFSYWPGWDVARRMVLLGDGTGGYVMDAYGGLHPFAVGNNPMPTTVASAYWPNWTIARAVAISPGSTASNVSGVTLDGFGGVHPFGTEKAVTGAAYWPNWDIARAVALARDSTAAAPKGWVLDGWGGCHPFGGAVALAPSGYWPYQDVARQILTY